MPLFIINMPDEKIKRQDPEFILSKPEKNTGYLEVVRNMESLYLDLGKILIKNFNLDLFTNYAKLFPITDEENKKFQIEQNVRERYINLTNLVNKLSSLNSDDDLIENAKMIYVYIESLKTDGKNKTLNNIYKLFNRLISEINDIYDLHNNPTNKNDKFDLLNSKYINSSKIVDLISSLFNQTEVDAINNIISKLSSEYNSLPMIANRVDLELEKEKNESKSVFEKMGEAISHKKLVKIFELFRSFEPNDRKKILDSTKSYKDFISVRIKRLSDDYNFSDADYENAYKQYVETHVYDNLFQNLGFNLSQNEFRNHALELLHRRNIKNSDSLMNALEEKYNKFVIENIEKNIIRLFVEDNRNSLESSIDNLVNLYNDCFNNDLPNSEKNFKDNLRDIFKNYLSRKNFDPKDYNYEKFIDLTYNKYIEDLFSVIFTDFKSSTSDSFNTDTLIKYLNEKLYHNQFLVKIMLDKFQIYFKEKYKRINDFSNTYQESINQNAKIEKSDSINFLISKSQKLIDNTDYLNDFIKNIFYIDKYHELFIFITDGFGDNITADKLQFIQGINQEFDKKYNNIDGSFNFFKRIFVTKGFIDYKIKEIKLNPEDFKDSDVLSKLQNLSNQINLIVNLEDELVQFERRKKELLKKKAGKTELNNLNENIKNIRRKSSKLLVNLFGDNYNEINENVSSLEIDINDSDSELTIKEAQLLINLKQFFNFNLDLLISLKSNIIENSDKKISIDKFDSTIQKIKDIIAKPQNKENNKKIKELIHLVVSQFDNYKGDREFYTGIFALETKLIDTIDLINELYENHDSEIDKKTIPNEMLVWNLGENPLAESFKIVAELIKRTNKKTSFLFDPLKTFFFSKIDKFKNESFSILRQDSMIAYNNKLQNIVTDTKNTIKNWWNYEIGRAENANLTETAKRAIYNTVHRINQNIDNHLVDVVKNVDPINLLGSLINSQLESYLGNIKNQKQIEVLLPTAENYSVLIFRSAPNGEIQAKKILIDNSLIGNSNELTTELIRQLSSQEQGWQKVDPELLQKKNSEHIKQGVIKKAIPSQISELSDYFYGKFFGQERYEQRVKENEDKKANEMNVLNEKYNDTNDIFHSHMVFSLSDENNIDQQHPLNNLLMNPYLYGAWGCYNLEYDSNRVPKLITNHNHTKVDGATARDVIGKNFERAILNTKDIKNDSSSINGENLLVNRQVVIDEKESNFTKIFNVKLDSALDTENNFTSACSEIFLFFKEFGFNFNAHNIEQLIIMNAFDIDNSHFLENRNGVLIPVPQILSPVSKDFLQWKTETLLKNKFNALEHFLELGVDNKINTSLRKQTVADNGLPIVPIISDMAGSNRLAMRELLQMSGLIAIARETKIIGQSYLVSNVSNQKDPVSKDKVTQDEFTTAGSGAYPEFSIGIYNSLDGSTYISFRTDNRAKKKYTEAEVKSRLLESTRKIMAMFNNMKLIIKENPELASLILK